MWKPLKLAPWLISASVAWTLGFLYNTYYGGLISWLARMYENKVVLAAEIQQPKRLLIVGGSGAHYTVNSQFLEQELNLPVFNFALDGNLGLNVILPAITAQVKPGDIVLLIPEYLMLLDEDGWGERSVEFGLATQQPQLGGLGQITPKEFAERTWLLGVPSLRNLTKSSIDLITLGKIDEYYTDPLTKWGDPTKTWERKSKWWKMTLKTPVTPYSIQAIAQFRKDLEAKGAHLILSLPVILAETDEQTVANAKKTAEELSQIAPTIYDPQTFNLLTDSSLFADTHYHLKPEARMTRSKQIIKEIQPILDSLNLK